MPTPATEINLRLKLFCENVLSGMGKREAYLAAGFKTKFASVSASQALANPVVKEYMEMRQAEMRERTNVTAEKVIKELARLGFADIREVCEWTEDGVAFIPSNNLTDDEAASIASVKSRRRIRRDKEGGETETVELEVKMHPKLDALEKLNKILGMYQKERVNDQDADRQLLATVLWRFVMAMHLERGITVAEAVRHAELYPEEVEKWGKEVKLLPAG